MSRHSSEAAEILSQIAAAILTAHDSVRNLREYFAEASQLAFLAIRDCERELDSLESDLDERIPAAITLVDEQTARELIASVRFVTDLERVIDLTWWVATRYRESRRHFKPRDLEELFAMLDNLAKRLPLAHQALIEEDAALARDVIAADRELDELRNSILHKNLGASVKPAKRRLAIEVIFMAQALERAGDHINNFGEELIHLIEKRSVRHSSRKHREM